MKKQFYKGDKWTAKERKQIMATYAHEDYWTPYPMDYGSYPLGAVPTITTSQKLGDLKFELEMVKAENKELKKKLKAIKKVAGNKWEVI